MASSELATEMNATLPLLTQANHVVGPIDAARCQHQREAMSLLLRAVLSIEQRVLLSGVGATSDDDGHVGESANQIDGERRPLTRRIELEIPGDTDPSFGNTELDEALRIDIRSRTDRVNPA